MSSPKTFDEVAEEIAKEKGISLDEKQMLEEETPQENIPISIIDEDNRKIQKVMKTLEEWGWHPSTQKHVKIYTDISQSGLNIVDIDKDGKKVNPRNAFTYLHFELTEELYRYQSAVNCAIRNEDYNFSLRKKIIIFLGPKCLFCGNEDIDYLQLDHKDCHGGKERKEFKERGLNLMLFYWNNLINAYIKLQVLCIKCHRLKSTYRIRQSQIDEKVKDSMN